MMYSVLSKPEIILNLYDDSQKSDVQELMDSITKTTMK